MARSSNLWNIFKRQNQFFFHHIVLILIFSSVVYYLPDRFKTKTDIENFSTWENCIYYSTLTHFTVGFGDITPKSSVMRGLTIIHVLMAFLLLNF